MSSTFGEYSAALRTRDAMTRLMLRVLDQQRPPDRFGVVTEINPDIRTAKVRFGTADPVEVRYGALAPSAIGQTVKVGGRANDRWIVDVLGVAALAGPPSAEVPVPTGLSVSPWGAGALVAEWDAVTPASGAVSYYEVQFATDTAFTALVGTYRTMGLSYTLTGLTPGTTYYVRVRAVAGTGVGAWTSSASGVPEDVESGQSDGFPPADSPQPVIDAGLGWLMARWVAQPNQDLVTYEVHVSATTGFTPSAATLLGETTGTFFSINRLPNGTALSYDNPTFVRLIAKDADGAATAGAQAFGTPQRIELGDVGNVVSTDLTDGQVPASSPTPTFTGGIGFIYVKWDHITNADAVTYEVHLSTTNDFTPTANTLVNETPANFSFIRRLPPGLGGGALAQSTTYYVKIFAKDSDGYAPSASTQVSGTITKAASGDLSTGIITNSLISAEANIDGAKIATASIDSAKIASLSANKITSGTLDASLITVTNLSASAITSGTLSATRISGGTLDASLMTVTNLSASAITSGTMSANRISGGTIQGTVTIGTTLQTAASGQRIAITSASGGRVQFYNTAGTAQGYLAFESQGTTMASGLGSGHAITLISEGTAAGDVYITARTTGGSVTIQSGTGSILLNAATLRMGGNFSPELVGTMTLPAGSSLFANGVGRIGGTDVRYYSLTDENHRTFFDASINGPTTQGWAAAQMHAVVPACSLKIQSDGNVVQIIAGVPRWSTGQTTSSRSLKRDVKPYTTPALTKVRQMRPKTFKWNYVDPRPEAKKKLDEAQARLDALPADAEPSVRRPLEAEVEQRRRGVELAEQQWTTLLDPAVQAPALGFIAEELAEIEPLVTVAATDQTPMGIDYDRVTALLVLAVQENADRLDAMEARLPPRGPS